MQRLSPGAQRLVAFGLLLLAIFIVWSAVLAPLAAYWRTSDTVRELALEQLARYRARATERPALARQLASLETGGPALPGAWEGSDPTLAAAKLQAEVKRLIAARGGDLRSAQVLPVTKVEGLSRIALQVDLTLPVDRLPELLRDIGEATPYLFVETLAIRAEDQPGTPSANAREPRLGLRCDIAAFMRGSA